MHKSTVIVIWCIISCVKSDLDYIFEKPPPVLKNPSKVQSTDVLNPLKLNNDSDPKLSTTNNIDAAFLKPTPVLGQFQTTDVAKPRIDNEIVARPQLSTTAALPNIESLVNPTPVVPRLQTGAANPILLNNLPVSPQSTGVVGNDVLNPTPVIISIETKPVAAPSTNDDPESPYYEDSPAFDPIEPSQVFVNNAVGTTTAVYTPYLNYPQPIKVASTKSPTPEREPVRCICKDYENQQPAALGPVSQDTGIPLTPQFFIPVPPKYDVQALPSSPNSIYQHIGFQLNLFLNNVPVFHANVDPQFFYYKK